jgi:iron-regulated transmembrane protein
MSFLSRLFTKSSATQPDGIKTKHRRHRRLRWVHKWGGLFFTLFLIIFALSGIVLNHRVALSEVDVPRSVLPPEYRMEHWNLGAVKGTLRVSSDSILLYGENGLWLTDSSRACFSRFERGMRSGADNRLVANVVRTHSGQLFAVTTFDAYQWNHSTQSWQRLTERFAPSDRMTDAAVKGDTLVLQSRSELFLATAPYAHFERIHLKAPTNAPLGRFTFRTLWMLHSGELFGAWAQYFVDFLGVILIVLCLTGVVLAFFPKLLKRQRKRQPEGKSVLRRVFKFSLQLHNKLGVYLLAFLLLLTVTGMFLRPPLLVAIARLRHQPLALTHEHNPNPWWDNLRMIRYDRHHNRWLLQTPFGFFTTSNLHSAPTKLEHEPPVGFMGTNVLQQEDADHWIAGSFSGLYRWNARTGESWNLYTGQRYVAPKHQGIPDFTYSVSGYSKDLSARPVVFDYNRGAEYALGGAKKAATDDDEQEFVCYERADFSVMPEQVQDGRLSLWRVALETHTGRIYTFLPNIVIQLFIFLSGTFLLTVLISGFIIWRKFHRFAKSR